MKYSLLAFSLCLGFAVSAQTNLTISYQYRLPNENSVPGLPVAVLAVQDSVSYYYPVSDPADNAAIKTPLGSGFQPNSVYTDYSKKYTTVKLSLRGTDQYIVRDSLHITAWQFKHDFERVVAGYLCKKAFAFIGNKKVTVFYSPELPPSLGPGITSNLPGTILEVWFDGQAQVLSAGEVVIGKSNTIVEPTSGQMVSAEKLDRIISRINFNNGFTNEGGISSQDGSVALLPINLGLTNYCVQIPGISRPTNLPLPNCCLAPQPIDINRTVTPRYDPNIPRAKDGTPWVN